MLCAITITEEAALRKIIGCLVGLLAIGSATSASADPVDNPGDARFKNVTGNYQFWTFASTEKLTSNSSANPEFIDGFADSNGDFFYNTSFFDIYATTQTIGVTGTPIEVQIVVSDVTGTVDFTTGDELDWQITAQLRFRATGLANVQFSTCRTSTFTIDINGDFVDGINSTAFTIPALSGSGAGACNGHATEINLDFALGSSGASLFLNKWGARNQDTGLPLTGS